MSSHSVNLLGLTDAERARAKDRVVAALRGSEFVVLPTETLYGVAARADLPPNTLAEFRSTCRGSVDSESPFTWHTSSAPLVIQQLGIIDPLHRRALERLSPGPIRFVIELPKGTIQDGLTRASLPLGVADDGVAVHVRIPDEPFTRGVLDAAESPIIIERLPASWGDPSIAPSESHSGIALVINAGKTRLHRGSTTIRLGFDARGKGMWEPMTQGVVDPRIIERRIRRLVLFVCTGNTCRSPMAQSIATFQVQNSGDPGGIPTVFASAGVAAFDGDLASPENNQALRALGVRPLPHQSKPLTPALAREADVVYTMTQQHARAVRAIAPDANVLTLDPMGGDVADPIGGGPEAYLHTARTLDGLVRARLAELSISNTDDRSNTYPGTTP